MTQYAGQMLPVGDPRAISPDWVPADGTLYPRAQARDYFRRIGRRVGGLGLAVRVPAAPGWLVLLRDDESQADLPPDTPKADDPPRVVIIVAQMMDQAPGACTFAGSVSPEDTALQAAINADGALGPFAPIAVNGGYFVGSLMVQVGVDMRIRVRQADAPHAYAESNRFAVSL